MQKLIDTLKGFGIEIPEEKHADVKKVLSEHYKNIGEFNKTTGKLENERDGWKKRAETAEETLKGFEGKDFDTITKERDEWKKKAEDAEKEYFAKEAEREKQELLKEAFADIEFTSEAAKKAVTAQIAEGVSVKNGKLIGFNDLLEEAKKSDAAAFVDKQQQQLDAGKAQFTQPASNKGGKFGAMTKDDIMAIKDRGERRAAMLANKELFGI